MYGTSGNELVQNLNRLCRCYGACNCEDVCVCMGQFPVKAGVSLIDRRDLVDLVVRGKKK